LRLRNMNEIRLALSMEAMRSMAEGDELVFDIDGEDIRVFMRCDDFAVAAFQTQVQRALLHMLPVSDLPN